MQLSFPSLSILLLATTTSAFPSLPAALDTRAAPFTGFCILASNTCNITEPTTAAGLMVNCAAGGGLDGSIGRGQHNCTIDGNPCSWGGLFAAVFCDLK